MPEEKPKDMVTNTPVMTGRTIEVKGNNDSMNSPMMSPSARKDQIKNQALQTLKGIAGGGLSKFGPSSPDKKVIKMEKVDEPAEEKKNNKEVKNAANALKKLGI